VASSAEKWTKEAELTGRREVSHNSTIFTFKMEGGLDLLPGQHISIMAEVNGEQIMRPYTPIECRSDGFDCLIKIYPNGSMSQYLANAELGVKLMIRGVFSDVTYSLHQLCIPGFISDLKVTNLGMLAGGTGITPCY
jgi:cytochrome-b5 reductase